MVRSQSRRALWMQKLADEVVRGIVERVDRGDLLPGASIGTREDLARQFVTSAGVVDRALEVLEDSGVVAVDSRGNLSIIGRPAPEHGFELPQSAGSRIADVIAILELRLGVEVEAAALCAERRSATELEAVREAGRRHEDAAARRSGAAQADFQFHRAIAAGTRNSYILDLLDYLGPLLVPRMRITLPDSGGDGPDENLRRSVVEHAAIVAAIEAGDADAARTAMRAHLQRTIALMRSVGADEGSSG